MTVEFWKNKWNEQQDSLNELREENIILTKVVHEAAQHVQIVQDPSTAMGSDSKSQGNIRRVESKFDESVKNFKTQTHADTMRDLGVPFKGKDEEGEDLMYRAKQNI